MISELIPQTSPAMIASFHSKAQTVPEIFKWSHILKQKSQIIKREASGKHAVYSVVYFWISEEKNCWLMLMVWIMSKMQ